MGRTSLKCLFGVTQPKTLPPFKFSTFFFIYLHFISGICPCQEHLYIDKPTNLFPKIVDRVTQNKLFINPFSTVLRLFYW